MFIINGLEDASVKALNKKKALVGAFSSHCEISQSPVVTALTSARDTGHVLVTKYLDSCLFAGWVSSNVPIMVTMAPAKILLLRISRGAAQLSSAQHVGSQVAGALLLHNISQFFNLGLQKCLSE